MTTHPTYEDCPDCFVYGQKRMDALLLPMVEQKAVTGEMSQQILDRYMSGVHARHLAGLSLDVTA